MVYNFKKRDRLEMSSDRIGTFFHKAMETFINNTRQQQVELKELVADSQELRRFIDEALQAAEKNPA